MQAPDDSRPVFFLGPLPPPHHGFSAVNAAMLELLRERAVVTVFDRNTTGSSGAVWYAVIRRAALVRWAITLASFLFKGLSGGRKALYAGLSGGTGQALELPFFLIARCLRMQVFLHHHSFAYLNAHSRLTAWCCHVLAGAHHVVLCEHMAALLGARYGVRRNDVTVMSNAAFLRPKGISPVPVSPTATTLERAQLTVGYLSNITEQKGIFDFINMLKRAQDAGLPFCAEIAGPVDSSITERFTAALSRVRNARHVGAVYGNEKDAFYQRIDLLVFPSKYGNEAEPLTILEGLAAGVEVLATDLGCVGGMVPRGCGEVAHISALEALLLTSLASSSSQPERRRATRALIQHEFGKMWEESSRQLHVLLEKITGRSRSNAHATYA